MAWDESWRSESRANTNEIPTEYSPWPTGIGWAIFAYFAGVTVLFVLGLYTFGSDPSLVFGLPVLGVFSVLIVLAFLVGMLAIIQLERGDIE